MTKPTCGPLYLDGLRAFAGSDLAAIRLFAAGFVSGQAEKVYLGACRAAMFRPSSEYQAMVWEIVEDVANRYGLFPATLEDEIWICRDRQTMMDVEAIGRTLEVNSMSWHAVRGQLCGVPASEIDLNFHKRNGYGEPCDRVEA